MLEFLARLFACCNASPIQFLSQVVIRLVCSNASFQNLNLLEPMMVLEVLGLFIDKCFGLMDVLGAIDTQGHGRKRLSVGSKEGSGIHIHIHASMITGEPDVERFIASSFNSICQFRVQEHVINARLAS